MKLLSSYPYHIALLFSFGCISADNLEYVIPLTHNIPLAPDKQQTKYEEAKNRSQDVTFDDSNQTEEKDQSPATVSQEAAQELTLADHFKHALTSGLIKTCETHHIDELNAHIYSPEDGCTFSSTVNGNGDGLVDRVKRIAGTEPTITISTGALFTPEETQSKIRFKQAMLKFVETADLPCSQTIDSNGNKTVVCSIVMTLKEFAALKELVTAERS